MPECLAHFASHRGAISGQQDQTVDAQRPHGGKRLARLAAGLIAQHKAAEAAPAVGDPHLRDVPVVFRSDGIDAEIVEQRPAPEDGLPAIDHRDHAEPRPLLQIARRRAHDSARQRFGHDGARNRMQGAEAARRRHGEQRLFGFALAPAGSA